MTPFCMRRVTLAYARRHLGALLDEVRDRGPVFIKHRAGGRRHGAVLCSSAWVLDRAEVKPSTDERTAPEPSPILTLKAQRERAVTPSVPETQAPKLNMTTIDERIAALKAARVLLETLAQAPDGSEAARYGRWYLQDYPQEAEIGRRLSKREGYGLLLAVRRIERVRELVDRLRGAQFPGADLAWAENAGRITRHYPERHELVDAVHSPHAARVWAAFYLDRAPGRSRLLLAGQPPDSVANGAARREAWRCLPSLLEALERDPNFPPWGVAEARWALASYPRRSELGCRLSGLTDRRFHEVLEALERACQLIEAVVGGTFLASLRQHARAQRISRHLPHSEDFPLTSLGADVRQAWVTWLFASRNGSRPSRAAPPNSSLNN